ncbi:MAG TPA: Tn3 family transposase [Solirubrobacteraceae bacterium]|nr:Tn3 family transposase [Solirubrobacteraceae bacterium]
MLGAGRRIADERFCAQLTARLSPETVARLAELTGPDRETQEISMLALHLLQSALVYINTILLQRVLQEPDWAGRLTAEDRSGLTPLFWSNVNPYGTFRLGMDRRLDLEQGSGPVVPGSVSPAAT